MKSSKTGVRKFESIFFHSPIELANEELRCWRDCFEYVKKIIKNKNSLAEMTKVVQQDLIKMDSTEVADPNADYSANLPTYSKLQIGLFYTALICEERMVDDILKITQLINQDNFTLFLEKFNSVLLCFYRIKGCYYERLVQILDFLFECLGDRIQTTLFLFLRNAYFQEKNPEMIGYINMLVDFFILKKEKLSEKSEESWPKIFYKSLRLMSITMLFKETQDLHHKLIGLAKYAWQNHQKGILKGGREMFLAVQGVMKLNELDEIVSDLAKPDPDHPSGDVKIFQKMLANGYRDSKDFVAPYLILLQIPPFVEHYTQFICTSSKLTFNKHLAWMLERLEVRQGGVSEVLLVDYVRYILLCLDRDPSGASAGQSHSTDKVQRWYILGWVLRFMKSEVFKMFVKQALFFDWLFYKGEPGWFKVFEPVWLLMINSISKYKELSEELLDFLLIFYKEYQSVDPDIEKNLTRVFETFKNRCSTS